MHQNILPTDRTIVSDALRALRLWTLSCVANCKRLDTAQEENDALPALVVLEHKSRVLFLRKYALSQQATARVLPYPRFRMGTSAGIAPYRSHPSPTYRDIYARFHIVWYRLRHSSRDSRSVLSRRRVLSYQNSSERYFPLRDAPPDGSRLDLSL